MTLGEDLCSEVMGSVSRDNPSACINVNLKGYEGRFFKNAVTAKRWIDGAVHKGLVPKNEISCKPHCPLGSGVEADVPLLLSKMRSATAKLVHMTKLANDILDRLERTPCPRDLHMTETCTEHHRRLLAFAKGGHERMATDSPCTALSQDLISKIVFSYHCDYIKPAKKVADKLPNLQGEILTELATFLVEGNQNEFTKVCGVFTGCQRKLANLGYEGSQDSETPAAKRRRQLNCLNWQPVEAGA